MPIAYPHPALGEQDLFLFREGTHTRLAERLGGRALPAGEGGRFAVWAPNASAVSVVGDSFELAPWLIDHLEAGGSLIHDAFLLVLGASSKALPRLVRSCPWMATGSL